VSDFISKFRLDNKVAIITGAGQGIGRGIALAMAQAGADIVVAELNTATGEDTAAAVRDIGRRALAVPTDVRDIDQVTNMRDKALETFGKIDILVNNAGGDTGVGHGNVIEMSMEQWRKPMELNLESIFICCRVIGEVMVRQRSGSAINISSGNSLGPTPGGSSTGVAKAGVNHLTRTLAAEWGPYNVRANVILPGLIATPLTGGLDEDDPRRQDTLNQIPLGRTGIPEDIAYPAVFLASDAAAYISGQLIYIAGGMHTSLRFSRRVEDK
jgi:NAD(P)-dependent dehydrogenase (short-subunit alcohol dehydrogenase family)